MELSHSIQFAGGKKRIYIIGTTHFVKEGVQIVQSSMCINLEDEIITLDSFYNYLKCRMAFVLNIDNIDKLKELRLRYNMDDNLKKEFQGVGRSLLYEMIHYCLDEKLVKLSDTIELDASGSFTTPDKSFTSMIPLSKYYERLGFVAKKDYLEHYEEASKIVIEMEEYNREDTEDIFWEYNTDIDKIPMSGTISKIIESINKEGVLKATVLREDKRKDNEDG